jgi:1,4-dihydroxy-2-naphthoyl-CoA hydrolase
MDRPETAEDFNLIGVGRLPGLLGVEVRSVGHGRVEARLAIQEHHLAPNGYLHAATVVALADTACGYGCLASLPDGASGFTTIELKSNFMGTLVEGWLACDARLVHGGRTTQVWDADVIDATTEKALCVFRCTQMVLWPR